MSTSVMEPALRPTIIVLLDETGQRVYDYLSRLTPSLDTLLLRSIAVVRYGGDQGASSERLPVIEGSYDADDAEDVHDTDGSGGGVASDAFRVAVPALHNFNHLIYDAICDVQDVQTLDALQRADVAMPDPLTQIIVVGKANTPILGEVLQAVRNALAEAARKLGATLHLDAPILCALAHYDDMSHEFTMFVGSRPRDRWHVSPEEVSALGTLYQRQTDDTGDDDTHDQHHNNASTLLREVEEANARFERLDAQATSGGRRPDWAVNPLATFEFLYSRMRQDRRTTMRPELIDYIMAEAIFALAATGQTFAPSMAEVVRSIPGVSATKDRLGSLGACMVRFPRTEAESYCIASLGADLLEYWSEREQAGRHGGLTKGQRDALKEEMTDNANDFVTQVIVPWMSGDILADMPDPGPDGWPTLDEFDERTRQAGEVLSRVQERLERLIARDEIDRLIAARDPDGEQRRHPRDFAALWQEITTDAWRNYEDAFEVQWTAAVGSAYTAISTELIRFLDRYVDDIWLNSAQGWVAASDYVDAMSWALVETALEKLAQDRVGDDSDYEWRLRVYEQQIQEAYRDIETVNPNDPIEDDTAPGNIYGPKHSNVPPPSERVAPAYHARDADLYNGNATQSGTFGTSGVNEAGGFTPGDDLTGAFTQPTVSVGVAVSDPPETLADAAPAQQQAQTRPDPEPRSRREREDAILLGMGDLVAKRQLDRLMLTPAVAMALMSAPVLTLLALNQLMTHWPLSFGLVAAVVAGVCATLGAVILALWLRARRRAEQALALHMECLDLIARRRRRDVEERLRVYVVNRALDNVRDMRDHLQDWPARVQRIAIQMRTEAQKTSDDLFNGPPGYHDILVAYGKRLIPPEPTPEPPSGRALEVPSATRSPLWSIYLRFTYDRSRHPLEPWHSSLNGILDELRVTFRSGRGGIIRMSDDEFRRLLRGFLRGRFRSYLDGEMARLGAALDLQTNPAAKANWNEARDHATPPHGAPGGDIFYIAGQRDHLAAATSLGVGRGTQRIRTRTSARHNEWMLLTTLRRGGIPL